ncbi:hypothetical protein DR864_17850 [Runella rosea]|uniref:DUF4199 domain-containing protein n=1 Tax=Runella rosea TaxID=2259595 RepID=A0A344TLF2_9BACT|nr:DUF4199 domain-containing protein [Runella rosea]AXE19473.1 hypothetical protein DR864_17850 [Runella rosea]
MGNVINFFNKPILKIPLAFGVLAGFVCFLFFLVVQNLEKFSGTGRALDVGFFAIIIAAACWYYRKNIGKGYMHAWEGISIGYVVWLTGALLCGYLTSMFFYFSPSALDRYKQTLRTSLVTNQAEAMKVWGKEIYQQKLADISQLTPSSFIFDEFRFTLLLVIIAILLIALIFRKKQPEA